METSSAIYFALGVAGVAILLLTWTVRKLTKRIDDLTLCGEFTRKIADRIQNTLQRHVKGDQSHWKRFNQAAGDATAHSRAISAATETKLRKEFELKEKYPLLYRTVSTPARRSWFESAWMQNPRSWSEELEGERVNVHKQVAAESGSSFKEHYEFLSKRFEDLREAKEKEKLARETAEAIRNSMYVGVDLAREGSEDESIWAYSNPDTGRFHLIPDGDFDKFFKDLREQEIAASKSKIFEDALDKFSKKLRRGLNDPETKKAEEVQDLADKCKTCVFFELNQCEGTKSEETDKPAKTSLNQEEMRILLEDRDNWMAKWERSEENQERELFKASEANGYLLELLQLHHEHHMTQGDVIYQHTDGSYDTFDGAEAYSESKLGEDTYEALPYAKSSIEVREFTIAEVLRKLQETNEKLNKLAEAEPSLSAEEVSRNTRLPRGYTIAIQDVKKVLEERIAQWERCLPDCTDQSSRDSCYQKINEAKQTLAQVEALL